MERDHVQQHLYYYELIPIYYIWMIHGESSMFVFSYEYGNSCSSSMNDNLDFRRKKYNVVGPHMRLYQNICKAMTLLMNNLIWIQKHFMIS